MAVIDPSAVWDFAGEIVGRIVPPRATTTATVTRIDADGTVWVTTGDGGEAPAGGAAAGVSVGDTVTLEWDGAAMGIRGNVSNPSPAGSVVRRAVARAQGVADAAKSVADAVNQHFFSDTSGIHVTEATQEEWDASHAGANVLINSVGQLFRDGLNNLLTLTTENGARALTVWDGLGNAAGNVRAIIGETITLGNASDGSVVTIDSDSMDMVHGTDEMLHFGYGEGTAATGGTADAPYYTLGTRLANSTVGNYSVAEGVINTASGPTSHAEGYFTTASDISSHAEGFRTTASGSECHAEGSYSVASGFASHAEGYYATASGDYSHAQNRGTIAASANQTALGLFNVEDANDTYALIVGNGANSTSRSNALTVDWDGNVECAGKLMAAYAEDFCTIESGATEYNVNACWSNGACCTITLSVNLTSALVNGGTVRIARTPSGYVPPYSVIGSVYITGATASAMAIMGTGGGITLNNRSGSSISTSANIYVSFTFVPA